MVVMVVVDGRGSLLEEAAIAAARQVTVVEVAVVTVILAFIMVAAPDSFAASYMSQLSVPTSSHAFFLAAR